MNITPIIDEVHALLQTDASKYSVGDWNRARMDSPGRYVWVPASSTFVDPAQASNSATAFPRNLWTHRFGVQIYIWGEDLDGTVDMLHGVLAALRRVTKNQFRAVSAQWDRAQINERGYLVTLGVEVPLVVSDIALMAEGVPGAKAVGTITVIGCDPDPTPPPEGWMECPCP